MQQRPPVTLSERLILLVATGLGSGYAPVAPGTFGSVVGVLLAWPLLALPLLPYLLLTALVFWLGTFTAGRAERHFGKKDAGSIVIDEIAGILVTFIAITPTPLHLVLGFALFRLFDITKPPPCRWAERNFSGGLGVMADDVMAGVYACLVLHGVVRVFGI